MLSLILMLAQPAQAGTRLLINDGFSAGDSVFFQNGFVSGECWASIYVPDVLDYPFDIDSLQVLVGGSNAQEIFTVAFDRSLESKSRFSGFMSL